MTIRGGSIKLLLVAGAVACSAMPPALAPAPAALPPPVPYDTAVAQIARRQAADDSVVAAGGRSILLTHGAVATRVVVLLHGFTDSPEQFEALGRLLYAAGDNVYIPRLPHHAERVAPVRTLGRVRAAELAAFGDSVINVARGLGDTVIVGGLSAGGALTGHIAQTRREVRRAVLIAPAIAAGLVSDDHDDALIVLASRLPDITRSDKPDTTRPGYVQGLSTHGLAEVLRLGQTVREKASASAPGAAEMVFLLNELDHTVSEDASLAVARSWLDHGANVTVYRFPRTRKLPHNVMEVAARGGNPAIVLPVVEALFRSLPPPATVDLLPLPCSGLRCTLRRMLTGGGAP